MIYAIFVLNIVFAADSTPTRVLENNLVRIEVKRVIRPEAEPVSKPIEIALSAICKNKKPVRRINIPVCDLDIMDKDSTLSETTLTIAHHSWDAVKSSNNPDGRTYCDGKNKLFYTTKITDLCK